jgi:N-acetylneuraminic acid mutarotase
MEPTIGSWHSRAEGTIDPRKPVRVAPRGRVAVSTCTVILEVTSLVRAQTSTWSTKAQMPTARCCMAAGVVDGLVFAIGGEIPSAGPNRAVGTVEAYDPRTDTWTSKAPMPTPRYEAGGTDIEGVLYVVGGLDSSNSPTTLVEAYDVKTNRWTAKATLPTPRAGLVVAAVDGLLYAIGGFKPAFSNTNYDAVEAYDPKTDTWTAKAPMPTARCCMAAGVRDGLVYVAGGTRFIGHGGTETPATLEVYDPKTDTWTTKAPMPTGRGGAAGSVLDGRLFVAGGILAPLYTDLIKETVEAYDPETNTWSTESSMPTARLSPAGGVVDDTLYVVGGLDRNGAVVGVNEAFSPFLAVAIDIKPGDPNNVVNLRSGGTVPVAILGSAAFDPTTVDPATVTLAGAPVATRANGVPMTSVADVNADGYLDLLLHFRTQSLQLTSASTQAVLYGETFSGQRIRGADSVRILASERLPRSGLRTERLRVRPARPAD